MRTGIAVLAAAGVAHAQGPESTLARGETWSASPVVFGASGDTAAQQPAGPPPTPRHTGIKAMTSHLFTNFKYLPSVENLYWAGAGGGLALGAHPFDARVSTSLVGSRVAERVFKRVFSAARASAPCGRCRLR